jgi:hypothetical protein
VGAAFLIAALIRGWLDFLDPHRHATPSVTTYGLWLLAVVIGIAAAGIAFARDKDGALGVSALAARWLGARASIAKVLTERFLAEPVTDLTRRIDRWLPAADSALGRLAYSSGRLAAGSSRAPALPVIILLAVVLALAAGLLAPGVLR